MWVVCRSTILKRISYFFMFALGLCGCSLAFSICSKQGLAFVAVWSFSLRVLLLQSSGSRAHRLQYLWHTGLAAPWHVAMSPALAGGLLTTGPLGKSPRKELFIALLCVLGNWVKPREDKREKNQKKFFLSNSLLVISAPSKEHASCCVSELYVRRKPT